MGHIGKMEKWKYEGYYGKEECLSLKIGEGENTINWVNRYMFDKNWNRKSESEKQGCLACPCQCGIQDMKHLLLECPMVDANVDKAILQLYLMAKNTQMQLTYNIQTASKQLLLRSFLNIAYIEGDEHESWRNEVGKVFFELLQDLQKTLHVQDRRNILQTEPVRVP